MTPIELVADIINPLSIVFDENVTVCIACKVTMVLAPIIICEISILGFGLEHNSKCKGTWVSS